MPTIPPHRWPRRLSSRTQRLVVVTLLVLFFPSIAVATAYATKPAPGPRVVYALDRHRHVLPPGTRMTAGQHLTVVATGFRPRARVQVVDTSRRISSYTRADRKGVARTRFVVPGRHATPELSVVLAGRVGAPEPVPEPEPQQSAARRDPQVLAVTMPLFRRYSYGIKGGGVDAGGVGLGPGGHTGEGGGHGGGLANTGLDVMALLAAAALLIALGVAAARAGRTARES